MWRELAATLFQDARFSPPARPEDLRRVEEELAVGLPEELRALLLESNGIAASYGSPLVWSVAEIAAENLSFRRSSDFRDLYMPFEPLLFFGAEANGDRFGYRILDGRISASSWIYKWDHEDDSRAWFASGLKDYIGRCAPNEA
ncbi:MAG TPA: SMI1/KNR4 family protein [Vicinamibacteria bacterium]|nr:SMI1/KNR4 family protein [Vicinamibacteria bacterium]